MKKAVKIILVAIVAIVVLYGSVYFITYPTYTGKDKQISGSFDEYYKVKQKRSAELKTRPGNEEKLLRYSTGKTKLAILYIHGFGACRAEGEYIVDRLADHFKANTYYLRLPGHGTNMDEFASVRFSDYIDEVEEAVRMMPQLGEKVIVVGTSMGALLGIYSTTRHPDIVSALVICSPFFDYADVSPRLFDIPGGIHVVHLLMGKVRISQKSPEDVDGYQGFWYPKRYYRSYLSIADLKKAIAKDEIYRKITLPVQMVYYYKDKERQDKTASVKAMLHAYSQFGRDTTPNPLNRAVKIEKGSHVLFSKWVLSDKDRIEKEVINFIELFDK